MRRSNLYISSGTLALLCLLMLLQQFLMPGKKENLSRRIPPFYSPAMLVSTENALVYGEKRAVVVAMAAAVNIKAARLREAEKWCRLGVLEYRHPSLMVFYGDFLIGQKRFKEAERWYALALHLARKDQKKEFLHLVETKLNRLKAGNGAL